jgi:hypothetical protein
MIKPDMIPKECFVAYQRAFKRGGGVGDAIAAALNAWPGVFLYPMNKTRLILPLPQESRDE